MKGVSIVLCTYNGSVRLPETLAHIIALYANFPWEVIIIDNNSLDRSSSVAKEILSKTELNYRVIIEKEQGLSFARWTGIRESNFDLILFCDDDNHLDPNFLTIGFDVFQRNPVIGVLGSLGLKKLASEEPKWFDQFAHSYGIGTLGKKNGPQHKGSYHYGAACFFRKSALRKLHEIGFQSILSDRKRSSLSSGGDVELCYAVQLLGYELWFDERLLFHHFIESHRLSWKYYLKLKKGIAKSFPLLESYRIDDFGTVEEFKKHLKKEKIIIFKGILKSGLLSISRGDLESKANILTSRAKFQVYSLNYRSTISAFIRNKKLFGA